MSTRPKILAAVDFSPTTEAVLAETEKLARSLRASVILLHVTPIAVEPLERMQDPARWEQEAEEDRRDLEKLAEPLRKAGIDVTCQAFPADPPPGILDAIENERPTLAVLGTHGRRGLARFFLGSVSDYVLRRARRPVLIVPPVEIEDRSTATETPRDLETR